jgi:NAD(P)-dependent dehydrogenase (short-subunit alcohol dehydrogenase family)
MDPQVMEELAGLKSIAAIVSWIAGKLPSPDTQTHPQKQPAAPASAPAPGAVPAPAATGGEPLPATAARPGRFVMKTVQLDPVAPAESCAALPRHRFLIVPDAQGIGLAVADLLEQRGAEARMVAPGGTLPDEDRIDGMIYLPALDQGRPAVLPEAYAPLRAALLRGATRLVVATGRGGTLGYAAQGPASDGTGIPADVGLPGLARTLSREFPEVLVRSVDVDPKEPVGTVAAHIVAELLQPPEAGGPAVVGRVRQIRTALRVVPAPLTGSPPALSLGGDSVVLLTGGARGITGKTAFALAQATGCHLELMGRSPLPAAAEDADIAASAGPADIRRALIARGMRVNAEIEAQTRRLLTAREIRGTLAALATVAASVRYHQADVRDAASVQAVVGAVLDSRGRLDGVIHGAGVLDDKLVRDKTTESFRNVFSTKVAGARTLADALERGLASRGRGKLSFLVFFGSVSGVFGNRGQSDYSAANDALDTLSRLWADRFAGQVLSVDWGPWESGESGMVSAGLKREYERLGIGLIDADEGVACLLRELAAGQGRSRAREGTSQVIYACGDPQGYEAMLAGQVTAGA